jgi:hypothetical protein
MKMSKIAVTKNQLARINEIVSKFPAVTNFKLSNESENNGEPVLTLEFVVNCTFKITISNEINWH